MLFKYLHVEIIKFCFTAIFITTNDDGSVSDGSSSWRHLSVMLWWRWGWDSHSAAPCSWRCGAAAASSAGWSTAAWRGTLQLLPSPWRPTAETGTTAGPEWTDASLACAPVAGRKHRWDNRTAVKLPMKNIWMFCFFSCWFLQWSVNKVYAAEFSVLNSSVGMTTA